MRALIPSVNERWNGPLGWFFLLWLLVQPEIMAEDTKRVVLTFDDSKASHYTTVRPILLGLGFNATFFITEGFTFASNKDDYMTWEQIAKLNQDGFEIGNHTKDHMGVSADTLGRVVQQIQYINDRCEEHGIPRPISFAYPGNAIHPRGPSLMRELGFVWARRGGAPEFPYQDGRGSAFEPGKDHPCLLPSAGDARPHWSLDDFKRALSSLPAGSIPILQFHGVPDRDHPWVSTRPEMFEAYMHYLKEQGYEVLSLRQLGSLVDTNRLPADAWEIIEQRKAARKEAYVKALVEDADTGEPLAVRVYIEGEDGTHYYPRSLASLGSSVDYRKQNRIHPESREYHTTLSAGWFSVELPPGTYQWTIERGKEYTPLRKQVVVENKDPIELKWKLHRWIDMTSLGWYSGDTHVHRPMHELPNLMLAEDLNVAFPLNQWVTQAYQPPSQGDRNRDIPTSPSLLEVDSTHVIHPINTEYEIFSVDGKPHTLGAVFLLGHQEPVQQGGPPMASIARQAHAQGALLDLDKHDWPWSMALVPIMKVDLFELSNNHLWRTSFAFKQWSAPKAPYMSFAQDPQSGNEDAWMMFGFETYYTLLNCGFNLRPTAGTASGVHPVPLGFGRVYVHLEGGFSYDQWFKGLDIGRSFVSNGPMLLAKLKGQHPGFRFLNQPSSMELPVEGEILWDQPLEKAECVINGKVVHTWKGPGQQVGNAWRLPIQANMTADGSSWVALRCFGKTPMGRTRFAHSAPWHVMVADDPLLPSKGEIQYLISRVEAELDRSREILKAEAVAEYEEALNIYRAIESQIP